MSTTDLQDKTTGAEDIEWDLSALYSSVDDSAFQNDLNSIESVSAEFRTKWNGKIGEISNEQFLEMLQEYENIVEKIGRLGAFVRLIWSTDTEDQANGKNLQQVQEAAARAGQHLVFLPIEICGLSDARLREILDYEPLGLRRHWVDQVIQHKPYTLSEEVEQVLSMKSLTARMAWVRMHDELTSARTYELNGQEYTHSEMFKLMQGRDRETRKAANKEVSRKLAEGVRNQAFIFNTVIADQATNDRLRGHSSWIESRNMANEASNESVQALIDSVMDRYELVQRFYKLKQSILGYETFHDYDRQAPVGTDDRFWTWDEARDIVLQAYTDFHPTAGEIAKKFFDESWIHAPIRKGKNGGAYSAGTVPSAHPYVFLNYGGTNRDVQVMAHELGHGVHQYLSRQQGPLLMHTPLTIAETASVFGEILTFNTLFDTAENDEQRLAMLVTKLDDILATVFRQISFNRFEDSMHNTRKAEGELSVERFGELWMKSQKDQFGDSVIFSDGYENWWSYISHFMHVPGYVYAYAYGELLVLALHEIYKNDPESFPDKYIEMLSTGGAKQPTELLAPFNVDVEDASFWNRGLDVIERLISEAERLHESVKRSS